MRIDWVAMREHKGSVTTLCEQAIFSYIEYREQHQLKKRAAIRAAIGEISDAIDADTSDQMALSKALEEKLGSDEWPL